MPNYRRLFLPGGTWFFTLNLRYRESDLLTREIIHLSRAITRTKRRFPFRIEAMVVLSEHLHAVLTLPDGDTDFPTRLRLIKSHFVKSLPHVPPPEEKSLRPGERGIWQRRYWEHLIRDERDYRSHVDYCYFNPVKHGHVAEPHEGPYTTYHRDRRCGRYLGSEEHRNETLETGES